MEVITKDFTASVNQAFRVCLVIVVNIIRDQRRQSVRHTPDNFLCVRSINFVHLFAGQTPVLSPWHDDAKGSTMTDDTKPRTLKDHLESEIADMERSADAKPPVIAGAGRIATRRWSPLRKASR